MTYWNLAAEQNLNVKKNDIIGKGLWEVFPGSENTISYHNYHLAKQTKQPMYFEDYYSVLNKWYEIASYPSENGMTIIFKDITKRKDSEKRIKDNEKGFKSLIENSSDGIILTDEFFNVIYSSPGSQKITGNLPTENIFRLTHPDDLNPLKNIHAQVLSNSDIPAPFHGRFLNESGNYIWLEGAFTNMLHVDEVNAIVANYRDITIRKKLEDLLHKANVLARLGSWEVDLLKGTVYWSDITREIHEAESSFVPDLATSINFYKEGPGRDLITRKVKEAIELGKPWDEELQIVTVKNNVRWIRTIGETEFVDGKCVKIMGSFQDIDERKKAESKLIENENYLRTILENEPECVKVLNSKGELVSMNPAGLAMIEADNEQQVLGHHMTDLVNKKYKIGFNRLSAAVFKGNPGTFEFEITGLKGGCRWLETHAVPLKDTTGKIVNLLGVTRDITERKKAEEKIIESENRMRLATSSATMGIWYWDNKNDIMVWDKKLYQIYDINESQLGSVYEGWLSRLHPEDKDRVNEIMQTAIEEKKREYSSDFRIIWSDLSVHYIKGTGITEYDDNGNVIGMMGVNWDVTAEKERHLKLLESVITNTTDSVLITEAEPFDEPGPRILYVNEAFTKMTGYSSEEVIGKTPRILQGPKSDKAELKRLSEAIRRWESCEITTINYKKNGKEFWINFTLTPVANEKGWYTHWIAIKRDVTDQKIYISAIENPNLKLREIAWSQSHIVRASLTRMMGIVSVLRDIKSDSSEYNEWFEHFNNSASELDNIIKDIVSKAETILLN